ncbi:hypothetical protein JCM1840_003027 [Sporobolomyces johnsonii]
MASQQDKGSQLSNQICFLPAELLSSIFDLAYEDTKPSTQPICKALSPFQRALLYRHVKVTSSEQLKGLMHAVEVNAGLGAMVKKLDVNLEAGAPPLSNKRQLEAFFAAFTHLARLSLGTACPQLIQAVLSFRLSRTHLTAMTSLHVEAPAEWKNPFDPAHLCALNSYPSLTSLSVATSMPYRYARHIKSSTKKSEPLTKIHELTLRGEGVDLPSAARLPNSCPSLRSLTLDCTVHAPQFSLILPRLSTTLTSLSLKTLAFYDDFTQPCDTLLPRFSNLEHLYLGEATFTPTLFDVVKQLPALTSLGFGPGALFDTWRLEALIHGPARLATLKKVTLDVVHGKRGYRFQEDGDGVLHPEHNKSEWHVAPDWVVPRFTCQHEVPVFSFSYLDVLKLLRLAKRNGVGVDGTTVEAVKVMADYENEVTECAIAYAFEINDFTLVKLRELWGNFVVDGLICERRDSPFESEDSDSDEYW